MNYDGVVPNSSQGETLRPLCPQLTLADRMAGIKLLRELDLIVGYEKLVGRLHNGGVVRM